MEKILARFWKYKLDHVIVWLSLIIYLLINRSFLIEKTGVGYYLKEIAVRILLLMLLLYTNVYYLIPVYFFKKKYIRYAIGIIVLMIMYVAIRNYQDIFVYRHILDQPEYAYFHYSTFPNISNAILYSCLFIALKFSKQYYFQQQLLNKIKVENLDTELKYLKAQINPHSIFNSINSIFSLIDKTNDHARAALAKFSDILRYQLYECSMDKIDISKELNYLNNFVELQKLRMETNTIVNYNTSNNVKNFKIAPLLIVPFVENAFKYVSSNEDAENRIDISLDKYDNMFILKIFNTSELMPDQLSILQGGIGLSNVKRRLELLYPNQFILTIDKQETSYSVSLKLEI